VNFATHNLLSSHSIFLFLFSIHSLIHFYAVPIHKNVSFYICHNGQIINFRIYRVLLLHNQKKNYVPDRLDFEVDFNFFFGNNGYWKLNLKSQFCDCNNFV
jgi:hypothetical protein